MSFTNYLEHSTLNYIFGLTSFIPSGTLYIGLSTTAPGEDGSNFTEPANASGYNRASIANMKAQTSGWSTAAQLGISGEVHNMGAISFGPASGNWGTVTHAGVWDSPTAGNLLTQGPLYIEKSPTNGDTVIFSSGSLSFRLN